MAIRHRARRRKWLIGGAAALVLGGIAAKMLVPEAAPGPEYRTAPVERRTIVRVVEATGELDVVHRVEVPAPGAGRLVEILARTGETVTEGQSLAKLDQHAAGIALSSAQATVAAASSRVKEAETALATADDAVKRTERLLERKLASPRDLDAARAAAAKARAAVQATRSERTLAGEGLKSARLAESLTTIVAPMAGVLLRAPQAVGSNVAADREPLFVIGSPLEVLRIDADVAESDIGEVKPGQPARFNVPAFGYDFDAKVEKAGIDARKEGLVVRYPVELRVDNPERKLLPGMTATVRIELARSENALATREAALRFRPEDAPDAPPRSRVFRMQGGRLEAVPVTPGISDGAFTELRTEKEGMLPEGTELALGVLAKGQNATSGGAGIRLGNK